VSITFGGYTHNKDKDMLELLSLIGVEHITEVIVALIAVFSGAGYWAWKTKKVEVDHKSDHLDREFKLKLLKQVQELMKKIDDLQSIKSDLVSQVYQLKTDLKSARHEIAALQSIIKLLNQQLKQ
jgi:peptidoglycan hydrolase CwlO-like protein